MKKEIRRLLALTMMVAILLNGVVPTVVYAKRVEKARVEKAGGLRILTKDEIDLDDGSDPTAVLQEPENRLGIELEDELKNELENELENALEKELENESEEGEIFQEPVNDSTEGEPEQEPVDDLLDEEALQKQLNDPVDDEFVQEVVVDLTEDDVNITEEANLFALSDEISILSTASDAVVSFIDTLDVKTIKDREAVVLARRRYTVLSNADKALVTNLVKLQEAEAKILKLWIDEVYDNEAMHKDVILGKEGAPWYMRDGHAEVTMIGYDNMTDAQKAIIGSSYDKLVKLDEMRANFAAARKEEYAKAKVVENLIYRMDSTIASEVAAARTAYDALTLEQKSFIKNYEILKKAEGKNDVLPSNFVYSGTRSSGYGVGNSSSSPWFTKADWGKINDRLQNYFPGTQPTYVWIVAPLSTGSGMPEGGCSMEFAFPGDEEGKYLGKTQAEWQQQNIRFSAPNANYGHASHEEYLTYFDENDIYVYLQVESGFADMKALMDIVLDRYGHHKSVLGFAIDVEWYWGVTEDSGIPVSDDLAKEWNEYLKAKNKDYRLVLKEFRMAWLPPTYRSDIIFCIDSQSFGSIDGEVSGMHDNTIFKDYLHGDGEAIGLMPFYREFAEYFYPNDVIYQVGYRPDAMWFAPLDEPSIKSYGVKLAEITPPDQKMGIAWVDFSMKLPIAFPDVLNDYQIANGLNQLLTYLTNSGNNWVGRRLGGAAGYNAPTMTDAMFVARMRQLVNELTENQMVELLKLSNIQTRLNLLTSLEPKALDIRISNLPTVDALKRKDAAEIAELRAVYGKFTDAQKEAVTKLSVLDAAEERVNALIGDAPAIAVVKIIPTTIVQGYAANVVVEIEGENLEGRSITATLFGKTGALKGNRGIIKLDAADVKEWGTFNVVVAVEGTSVSDNSGEIYVEKKNDNIWDMQASNENGKLKLLFVESIGINSASGGNVFIGDKPFTYKIADDFLSIEVDADAAITGMIVVKGVKYERLFPSFTFTFTLQK